MPEKPKAAAKKISNAGCQKKVGKHPAFGMWKDRKELGKVDQFVRNRRKGRRTSF
ncbi:MAG TPA: hypothetical protein VIH42_08575 [Thermoguttaceae bacterium]